MTHDPNTAHETATSAPSGPVAEVYRHTQRAPLHFLFYPLTAMLATVGWLCRDQPPVMYTQWAAAACILALAFMFQHLTVRDGGSRLVVRFGPLPVFGCSIPYADITAAEASKSALVDGWGVHWIPGRGTTYNLWGFGCVKLTVRGKTVRIGSNDVERLAAFVRERIGQK